MYNLYIEICNVYTSTFSRAKGRNLLDSERKVFPSFLLLSFSNSSFAVVSLLQPLPPCSLFSLLTDDLPVVFCKLKALGLLQIPIAKGPFCWVCHHPFLLHWRAQAPRSEWKRQERKQLLLTTASLARSWPTTHSPACCSVEQKQLDRTPASDKATQGL